ncbi:hypothetical protein SEUCBS139899_007286 [Sporothrix eucalyptigena]|uniref:Uncharacterized protein n=1 Tax=Sporothrix eucalyptigena TaxID=1812306 RepID=A0ABP0C2A1_9PEZI
MPYTVTEPHPTVQANAYTHSGRGGLGNTFRAPTSVTPAAGIPTPLAKVSSVSSSSSAPHSSTRFYAGRGGAGNAYPVSERRGVSLDDEYVYASTVAKSASRGYVGRGGAGNFYSSSSSSSSSNTKKSSSSGPYLSTADKIAQSIRNGVHGYGHGNGSSARKGSDASSVSGASMSSDEGARRSGFWGRMHR